METISKEAFNFLIELKKNNNRDWFDAHKPTFKKHEKRMKTFYAEVENMLNQHDQIEKTKAFRIYRDVRFSKDKTPYKTHFSASFSRKKPELRGGYYLHIQPENKSFLAVGFWSPNKKDLTRIRKEMLVDAKEVREILENNTFQKYWGSLEGEHVKTAPKGFDRSHKNIDLINQKQWVFTKAFSDSEVLSGDFITTVDTHYQKIRPFFDYMSAILTTDLNGVSLIE